MSATLPYRSMSLGAGDRARCGSRASLAILAVALLVASCADPAAAAAGPDGTLVLELGGGQPSLASLLQRYGVRVAAPHDFRTVRLPGEAEVPVVPGASEANPAANPAAAPAPDAATTPDEKAAAEAAAAAAEPWFEVPLPKGKSLIHLAKQYLGDANRFRELLQLNGWTEKDARTLREGTKVKIPREPKK